MKALMAFGTLLLAVASMSTVALADGQKNLGSQPSRDQLIEMLAPHGGATPTERGLRVKSANPAMSVDRTAPSSAAAASSGMPSVALDIKFAFNSAVLTGDAKDTISRLGSAFQSDQLADYRFRVEGHTDATGRPDYNLALSQRRAESVRDYLVNVLHVAPNRLQVVGRGQEDPLDPTDPTSAVNRRVQVVNIGQ